MSPAPEYVSKINSLIDSGWPWVMTVPALLTLLLIIAPIGIWVTLARRNRLLDQQLKAFKYQVEVIKWLGQSLRDGSAVVPLENVAATKREWPEGDGRDKDGIL